ncbi:Cullin-5 [Portunus trituberculatus]|uniref:Cullin-5 n=1 Tax=Portunus trituberculatus TaxID=210409 RepID=A0A5B7G2I6_PORTR|nr:Cullin-5 [Portunus trituberculatus]
MSRNVTNITHTTSLTPPVPLSPTQDKGTVTFEEKWPTMRPTVLKLLRQECVSRSEWQDLFWAVHKVCLWDEKGPPKVQKALQDDILDFISHAQAVRHTGRERERESVRVYVSDVYIYL